MHVLPNKLGALLVALTDQLETRLEPHSPSSAAALLTLLHHGQTPLMELSRILRLSQPATTRVVDRLETQDLVARIDEPGRVIPVHLTAAGRGKAQQLQDRRLDLCANALDSLDEADKVTLDRILSVVLAGLVTDRHHARQICRLCDHATCDGPLCPVGCAARQLENQPKPEGEDAG